jgi:hypothetical protein
MLSTSSMVWTAVDMRLTWGTAAGECQGAHVITDLEQQPEIGVDPPMA